MTWQQIVKGLLQVAVVVVVFVACDCWTPTYFNLCNETLASDSRKPHDIILCESEHEWIRSNASTSLKNSTSVSDCATNVPESNLIYLRLCRLHTTWIVGMSLCRLVGINRNPWGLVLVSEWVPRQLLLVFRSNLDKSFQVKKAILFVISLNKMAILLWKRIHCFKKLH